MNNPRELSPVLPIQTQGDLIRDRVVQSGGQGSTVPELCFALGLDKEDCRGSMLDLELKSEIIRTTQTRDEYPVFIGAAVSHLFKSEELLPLEDPR